MNSYLFLQGSPPQTFVFFIINTIKESHLIISCKTSPKKQNTFLWGLEPTSGRDTGTSPTNHFSNQHFQGFALSMLQHSMFCMLQAGVSGNSLSRPFPKMKASDSCSRIMGMDFFIPFPFPSFGNALFSFPSRSRIMGMVFCSFPSRSRILGMLFFHSLTVP